MKKIFFAFVAMLCMATVSFSQTKKAEKPKTTKAAPAAVKAAGATKKDGTPDMRFKANKEAAKPAGPLKKDCTPDMRFKANKPAVKKKP
jgi:hypothetical protein